MFCGKCGSQIAEGSKFCNVCGGAVGVASTPIQDAMPPTSQIPLRANETKRLSLTAKFWIPCGICSVLMFSSIFAILLMLPFIGLFITAFVLEIREAKKPKADRAGKETRLIAVFVVSAVLSAIMPAYLIVFFPLLIILVYREQRDGSLRSLYARNDNTQINYANVNSDGEVGTTQKNVQSTLAGMSARFWIICGITVVVLVIVFAQYYIALRGTGDIPNGVYENAEGTITIKGDRITIRSRYGDSMQATYEIDGDEIVLIESNGRERVMDFERINSKSFIIDDEEFIKE